LRSRSLFLCPSFAFQQLAEVTPFQLRGRILHPVSTAFTTFLSRSVIDLTTFAEPVSAIISLVSLLCSLLTPNLGTCGKRGAEAYEGASHRGETGIHMHHWRHRAHLRHGGRSTSDQLGQVVVIAVTSTCRHASRGLAIGIRPGIHPTRLRPHHLRGLRPRLWTTNTTPSLLASPPLRSSAPVGSC